MDSNASMSPSSTDAQLDALLRRTSAGTPSLEASAPHIDDRELLAFSTSALDATSEDPIALHLAECVECRELLAQLSRPVSPALLTSVEAQFPAGPVSIPRPMPPRMRLFGVVAGLLAAAAAVAIVVRTPKNQHPDFDWVAGIEAQAIEGGIKDFRGPNEPESTVFIATSNLKWTLRATEASGQAPGAVPVVSAYVGDVLGTLRPVSVRAEQAKDGTTVISGKAGAILGPTPGIKTLIIALGGAAIDLEGRPTETTDFGVEPSEGVVFRKDLNFTVLKESP